MKIFITALFCVGILFLGCSTTIQEKKATETDPGNSTELKLTGQKVKVVHSF
ncbi:MAG TPA: hypothetical protein PKV84_05475 [Candidatus Omnitrophota bacterium]|nr:hypothetical protein [Candidatus Omnitrophota bacterium]